MYSPGRRLARIEELIGHAESPNAAYGGHALIPRRETAILTPEPSAVVVGAPRIRIVWQSSGGPLRQHRSDNNESCHKLGSKALLLVMGITPLGHGPFMWLGRASHSSMPAVVGYKFSAKNKGGLQPLRKSVIAISGNSHHRNGLALKLGKSACCMSRSQLNSAALYLLAAVVAKH
jgi:hypothetical protein